MSEAIYCKKLKAIYGENNGFLGGPLDLDIELNDGFQVEIGQLGIRTITISNVDEVSVRDLYAVLSRIVRLLMVFDGKFYMLQNLIFSESQNNAHRLDGYAKNLVRSRLSYFESDDACSTRDLLCSFEKVLTPEVYNNWVELLEDLDISHQMYLYSLSANKMPVDLKVSFLIELAEPIVELVKKKTGLYASLSPGERGTSLKMCLDVLITKYGLEIFKKEIEVNYEAFLKVLVNSRVRIMHIKKNQKGIYLNRDESVLYMLKISLLYRHILLSLLGIDESITKEHIQKSVDSLDNWDYILDRLLVKIRK